MLSSWDNRDNRENNPNIINAVCTVNTGGELLICACRAGPERKKNKNQFSTEHEVPAANVHDEDADDGEMFLSILQCLYQ